MKACNENIIKTLKLAEDMIELARQGDAEREDTGCGVLYGILLDSAYKIRKVAETEKKTHMKKGEWEQNDKSEHATI